MTYDRPPFTTRTRVRVPHLGPVVRTVRSLEGGAEFIEYTLVRRRRPLQRLLRTILLANTR